MLTEQNISKLFMLVVEVMCDGEPVHQFHLSYPHKNKEKLYNLLYDTYVKVSSMFSDTVVFERIKILVNDEIKQHIEKDEKNINMKLFASMIRIVEEIEALHMEYEKFEKTDHPFGTNHPFGTPKFQTLGADEQANYNPLADPAMKEVDKDKLIN